MITFDFDLGRVSLFAQGYKQGQVDGINAIVAEWNACGFTDRRWLAYMLATTYHETDKTMAPIEEYGKGKSRPYGKRIKMNRQRYTDTNNIFYGRGFVQLTWYENYQKAGKKLGIDLINKPELALQLDTATKIMFLGMSAGWFTGSKLSDHFNATTEDWVNARTIINGTDKAKLIAGYALEFLRCLG